MASGYSVKLVHNPEETSWEDKDGHGYVLLKSSDGAVLVRKGGFQHNSKLRSGGSWDPKAVEAVCSEAKQHVPLAPAA